MTHLRLGLVFLIALALPATLSGCGGGSNTPMGSVVGSGGGVPPPPTQLVNVKLTVTVPTQQRRHHAMHPRYVSPGTQSLTIQLASANGSGVTGIDASIVDVTPNSHNCKAQNGSTVCTATIEGSPGADVFSVTTYDALDAIGDVLSVGTASAQIGKGGGNLGISNKLSLSIDGIIASLRMALSPDTGDRGKETVSRVSLTALDASGAQIVGASAYQYPIDLSIQGDATHAFTLHGGGSSGATLSIAKPTSSITLAYDGNAQASSVTVQGSVSNTDPVSANSSFTLRGRKPPPPAGTIYVLNLGSNDGQGATVTEYDGSANGNAVPLRTLDLDPKLYARGITVDASGKLYVGYFDSSLGYSPANGTPDTGNLVAIYAAGADGNAAPIGRLTQDPSTSSTLFPLDPTLDASGGLVTFGATTVNGNAGDATLRYAPGASGQVAPVQGWNFANPTVYYAGPTGLVVDAAGNFYVSGALHTSLGPSYGVFVAAAADSGPQANPSRTIPWDATTQLSSGGTNVALDSSGEIVVANSLVSYRNSAVSCQGRANVFAAGASGGVTDVAPLRVLTLKGVFTRNALCASPRSPLQPFYPSITVYGDTLFAVDAFNNAVDAFPSGKGGSVAAATHIAGPATQLNAPVAVFVSSASDRARRER